MRQMRRCQVNDATNGSLCKGKSDRKERVKAASSNDSFAVPASSFADRTRIVKGLRLRREGLRLCRLRRGHDNQAA